MGKKENPELTLEKICRATEDGYSLFGIHAKGGKLTEDEKKKFKNIVNIGIEKIERDRVLNTIQSKASFYQYLFKRELFFIKIILIIIGLINIYLICKI
ncbi:hypothetical protein [Bilophila wadsworthia]|uniref:hypothetical protein n=1 Tax=Bilophila wadsworthia TaxID=35833 RepID=UPI0012DE4E4F|nr:hypothetical protein [Bilophila wadsworthia]